MTFTSPLPAAPQEQRVLRRRCQPPPVVVGVLVTVAIVAGALHAVSRRNSTIYWRDASRLFGHESDVAGPQWHGNERSDVSMEATAPSDNTILSSDEADAMKMDKVLDVRSTNASDQIEMARGMAKRARARSVARVQRVASSRFPSVVAAEWNVTAPSALPLLLCLKRCLVEAAVARNASLRADPTNAGCVEQTAALGAIMAEYCGGSAGRPQPIDANGWVGDCATGELRERDVELLQAVYMVEPYQAVAAAELLPLESMLRPLRFSAVSAAAGGGGGAADAESAGTSVRGAYELGETRFSHRSDGTCIPAAVANMTSRRLVENVLSGGGAGARGHPFWSAEELRVAFLVDLDVCISEAMAHRADPALGAAAVSVEGGALCMLPKTRAVVSMAYHYSWMFRVFRPPLKESDVIDVVVDGAEVSQPTFVAQYSLKTLREAKKFVNRNRPIYYFFRNIALPSRGGGLRGYHPFLRAVPLEGLRDEIPLPIRGVAVHMTSTKPRFIVERKKLFVFPVIANSNNIGHVMFRYYSVSHLFSRYLRFPLPDTVFLYYVLPASSLSFGDHNLYKVYYQTLQDRWYSSLSAGPLGSFGAPDKAKADNTTGGGSALLDITFAEGASGFGGVAQFHKGYHPALLRSKTNSLLHLIPSVQRMRRMSTACWQLPDVRRARAIAMDTVTPQDPLLVVVIRRRRRQIINIDELLRDYLQRAQRAGGASDVSAEAAGEADANRTAGAESLLRTTVLRDPTTKVPIALVHVVMEFLSIRQQAELIGRADVLVGTMGAGQCWMMYMRPRSAVVELHSSVVMRCTGVGVNQNRLRCDYSKQSVAAGLHHIGFPLRVNGWCQPLMCSGSVSQPEFDALMATAICTVGRSTRSAGPACSRFFPILNTTSEELSNSSVVVGGHVPLGSPLQSGAAPSEEES